MSKGQQRRFATAKHGLEQMEELLKPYEKKREVAPSLPEERWEAAPRHTVHETLRESVADRA